MKHMIWTLLLMITVGVLAFGAGRNSQSTTGPQVLNLSQIEQPRVVLAKSGTSQQKDAREQNEGCQVTPKGDLNRAKTNEQDGSSMKGWVF